MPVKKKKISELTLTDNLKGLYTIGVKLIDGIQTSVKVSLEYIQTAYDNVVKATKDANEATKSANTAAKNADTATADTIKATSETVKATEDAQTATKDAINATKDTKKATDNASIEADRAKELADHPTIMGENGNWWKWDSELKKYVDTGDLAKGGVLYPSFEIEEETMELIMTYQDDIAVDQFEIDTEGCLNFKFK